MSRETLQTGRMLNFHPVDQSESTQHQVVTATGQSSLLHLYGNEQEPIVVDDDDHFSEDDDYPAKKISFQQSTFKKDIIRPSKFNPADIDVTNGNVNEDPDLNLVSLKKNKKHKREEFEVIDVDDEKTEHFDLDRELDLASLKKSKKQKEEITVIEVKDETTFENLNIKLRDTAWHEAIIKSGKVTRGLRADNYGLPDSISLLEDNFRDFDHLNSRLYDEYLPGFVVLGSNRAVSGLLNATSSLRMGTHGVIVDMSLTPSYDGLFEEGECLQYQVVKELGKGSFGTVSYCQHQGGQKYVKKVIKEKFNRKEVEILMQLSHPNITAFRGYIFRDGSHEIMMEYGGKSMKTFMEEHRTNYPDVLTFDIVKKFAFQGFSALEYMYERFRILHLDIKPENICIQMDPPTLKFTDFGTSKTPQQAVTFDGWTPEYMSPEACRLLIAPKLGSLPPDFVEDLTGKADVFAFALSICFMLSGNHTVCKFWPKRFTREYTFMMWRTQYIMHLAVNPNFTQAVAIQDDWPKEMRDLLTSALEGSTNQRISASEACHFIKQHMLNHPVNIPTLLSPASPATNDLPTIESIYSEAVPSPLDVSLHKTSQPLGGGKDIKNQLRRKIRMKSSGPYQRQTSVAKTENNDNPVSALPVFAALGFD